MDAPAAGPAPRPETLAVHTGVYKDAQYASITTPIYASSIFAWESPDKVPGYDYTRSGNPTRQALEENLAALEGGDRAFAVASGMAAITAALMLVDAGGHVIHAKEVYGGAYRLFHRVLTRFGLTFTAVDTTDLAQIEAAIRPETRMIWLESPTNPLLNLVDLAGVAALAAPRGILTAVDNTLLTPVRQRPLALGIDLSVHSSTKYLNGHSDVIGGVVVARTRELSARLAFLVNAVGLAEAPLDAWLVLRGLKTLPARMALHERNAAALVEALRGHPAVLRIFYPGLPDHPQHALARRQQTGFGGLFSLELDTARVDLNRFIAALRWFHLSVSFGGVESLLAHPWAMSHAAMPPQARREAGLTPGMLRVSPGIEAAEDLIADFLSALEKAGG